MKKRYMLLGLLVVLLVVALTAMACGGEEVTTTTAAPSTDTTAAPSTDTTAAPSTDTTAATGPATGEPIKLGLSNSLTGAGAAPGDSVSKGVALQVEWVNENGGINGRPLEVMEYDDKTEVPNLVANLTKLIQEDKVFGIIGPFIQFGQEAARAVTEQAQIPHVGMGPATLDQIAGTKYTWSVMMSAAPPTQADALAKVFKANGWKNVLAIADILAIHQETLDLLVKAGPTEGFTLTKMPDTFGFDVTDFQPILNRIMEEYKKLKPDAVVLYVNPLAVPPLFKGLRALGVTEPIQGSPAGAHPAIFMMGPDAVEGFYVLDSGGIVNPQGLPDDWPLKAMQVDFVQRYTQKYGSPPDFFSAAGADLIGVMAEALKQAGGADDKEKVRQALINLDDLKTLEGIMSWTPDDTNQGVRGSMVEFQVKGAVFQYVDAVN